MNPSLTRVLIGSALASSASLFAACGGSDGTAEPTQLTEPAPAPAPAPTPAPTPTPTPTPTPPPAAAVTVLDLVKGVFAAADKLWADSVPASAVRMSQTDTCYLHNGESRESLLATLEINAAWVKSRDAYRIGETRSNVEIVAERDSINPDGSARKEVDVRFDVVYKDGSTQTGATATLISGSSAGTPGCTTARVSPDLRFLGNQQQVRVAVRGRNWRDERYSLANGAPLAPAVRYRRDVQFLVSDPMGKATYVVVTGPGPGATIGAPFSFPVAFSLKLISPRLLRSAPELAGRSGNFLNWEDDDGFRICNGPVGSVPVQQVADCAGLGAGSNHWGITTSTPNAAVDEIFSAQGWVKGGTYTFAVYNDDGWKTVNGHAGKTPIAVYTARLNELPISFAEMADDGYPRISFAALTAPQVQANLVSAAPNPVGLTWTAPRAPADGRTFRHFENWEFFQGPRSGNAGAAFNPAYRLLLSSYPGSMATSIDSLPVTAKLPEMAGKTYAEFASLYLDRNDGQIYSIVSFN